MLILGSGNKKAAAQNKELKLQRASNIGD